MGGKLKVTLDGYTKILEDSPETLRTLDKLYAEKRNIEAEPYDGDVEIGTIIEAPQNPEMPEEPTPVAQPVAQPTAQPVAQPASPSPASPAQPRRPVDARAPEKDLSQVWSMGLDQMPGMKEAINRARAIAAGVKSGSTVGMDEEIGAHTGAMGARLASMVHPHQGEVQKSPTDDRDTMLNELRGTKNQIREESPWLYGTGNVMGSVGLGGAASKTLAPVIQRLAGATGGAFVAGAQKIAPGIGKAVQAPYNPATSAIALQGQQLPMQAAQMTGEAVAKTLPAVLAGAGSAAQAAGEADENRGAAAALGAGVGAIGTKVVQGVGAGFQALGGKAKNLSDEYLYRVLAPDVRTRSALTEKFGSADRAREWVLDLIKRYTPDAASAGDALAKVKTMKDATGAEIGDALERIGSEQGGDQFVGPAWERSVRSLANRADDTAAKAVTNEQAALASQHKQYLDRVAKLDDAGNLNPVAGVSPKTLREQWGLKSALQRDVDYQPGGVVPDRAKAQAADEFARDVKDQTLGIIDEAAIDGELQAFKKRLGRYGDLSELENMAQARAARETGSSDVADYVSSLIGGTTQGAIGGAMTGNPIGGAVAGAMGATQTGTRSALQRALSDSQFAGTMSKKAASTAKMWGRADETAEEALPWLQQIARQGTQSGPADKPDTNVTLEDRLLDIVQNNPETLGSSAQPLIDAYNLSEEDFRSEVQRQLDKNPQLRNLAK